MTLSTELFTRERLTRIGIALAAIGVVATQLPPALARHASRSSDRQHLNDVAGQNDRMAAERELANSRYEDGCRILRDENNPAMWATFNAKTRAISMTNGLPLAPNKCVAGGDGTTGIVGEDGYIHSIAGNASPEVVQAAIAKQLATSGTSMEGAIND